MRRGKVRIISFLLILILMLSATTAFAKRKSYDESRFQVGFGALVSTSNLLGLIESVKMAAYVEGDGDYSYPGVTATEAQALQNLDAAMQRAILIANILGAMEYGVQFRLLWKILMVEADLVLLPFDGSYNGRLDFDLSIMAGVRAPFFIMPYILAGVDFSFMFYPGELVSVENWRGDWAATDNFVFRPGFNFRLGLDLKFKKFSIGAYYQYKIKDVQEFSLWYDKLVNENISVQEAGAMIFASQSRFGVSLCWYFL